jgi:excisionase family DNA binding protein
MPAEKLLTVAEAAARLRVSRFTMSNWLHAGIIVGVRYGAGPKARWRIRESDIESPVRSASPIRRLSEVEMAETAQALQECMTAGGIYSTGDSMALIVSGVEKPTEYWWMSLARGIRELQKGDKNDSHTDRPTD